MNINDWKLIQMRNDVKYIKRRAMGNNAASWSLVVDVFLVLLAFVLDRFFSDSNVDNINILWVIIGIVGVIIPVSLFFAETIRAKKAEKISLRVRNAKELVAVFDDEICYMIMSADEFNKNLKKIETNDSRQTALLLEFYIIEAEYYLNKAVQLLLGMDNNLKAVLDDNDLTRNHISKARLVNAISLLASFYEELFDFYKKKSDMMNQNLVHIDLSTMRGCYESLKEFATERKDLIEIDIENVFKLN